ncbi:MAG: outer membrane protein assembly factor BamA [Gammaproteobacteria bacterium]|nr:outer membrane protein assembly factor BamA [Gammaproteobacteria bacterium]
MRDIRVEGLQRVELGTFHTYLPLKVGESVDDSRIPAIIRALYRSGSFENIEVARSGDTMVFNVLERPTISALSFTGNKQLKTEDLEKGLKSSGIAKGEVLSSAVLSKIEQELESQYFSRGRYSAKVKAVVNRLPRNRVDIKFVINEGEAATIRQINIVGNRVFGDEALLKRFELTTGGLFSFFTDDNQYAKEKLSGDLEKLRSYYLDRGYAKFQVVSTQVSITPDKHGVFITINIDEGEKYKVKDFKLSGSLILPEAELRQLVPLGEGSTYSGALITFAEEAITNRLGAEGYGFAKVQTIPEIDDAKKEVSLNFFVNPGNRVYVRRVNFKGNNKTADEVLRREMRQMEGGWLNNQQVELSKTRLERLSYFEEVKVETPRLPGSDDQVDIEFEVKERASGQLSGGIGYSQNGGFLFNAGISQDNFLGSGKQVALSVDKSSFLDNINIGYQDPYFTDDGVSQGFSIFYRKTDLGRLRVSTYTTDTTGGQIDFGLPLNEFNRIGTSLTLQNTTINARGFVSEQVEDFFKSYNQDPGIDSSLNFDVLKVGAFWQHNSLNRGIFPTAGNFQSLSADVATPAGDLEYYKLNYRLRHYIPISRSGWSVYLRGELGYGNGLGETDSGADAKLPFFENYFAGGFNTVRGFEDNVIGPHEIQRLATTTSDPSGTGPSIPLPPPFDFVTDPTRTRTIGGNARALASAELIFPTPFAAGNNSVRTSLFVDAGHVWDTEFDRERFSDLSATEFAKIPDYSDAGEFRVSAGFAVQWISPLAPMTFSVSKPLKDVEGDDTKVFQFNLGQSF